MIAGCCLVTANAERWLQERGNPQWNSQTLSSVKYYIRPRVLQIEIGDQIRFRFCYILLQNVELNGTTKLVKK